MSDKCGATTEGAPFCESMDKKAIWKHQLCFAYRLNYEVFDFELKLINEKLLKIVALFSMPRQVYWKTSWVDFYNCILLLSIKSAFY